MNEECRIYFGLSSLPFTKEIPTTQLLQLPTIAQALTSLQLLIETRGIGVLTGKSGTGKSCLLRLLNASLHPGLYTGIYLCHTSIGLLEFYIHLCTAFGIEPTNRRASMFRALKDRILHLARSANTHPVILVDEASCLNNDILRELRLLANFDMDSYNALTILLCGQESLLQKFGLSILEPLANSITVSVSLPGLPQEEVFSYLEQRITACGGNPALFTKNAVHLIAQASMGILRTVNTIANSALVHARYANSPQVEKEHVQMVLQR